MSDSGLVGHLSNLNSQRVRLFQFQRSNTALLAAIKANKSASNDCVGRGTEEAFATGRKICIRLIPIYEERVVYAYLFSYLIMTKHFTHRRVHPPSAGGTPGSHQFCRVQNRGKMLCRIIKIYI